MYNRPQSPLTVTFMPMKWAGSFNEIDTRV